MSVYRAWDREEKLGPPPWSQNDPKLTAWEEAHGHDVRLKCYEEFGCRFAEIAVTDEMVERGVHAWLRVQAQYPWNQGDYYKQMRAALEAALDLRRDD